MGLDGVTGRSKLSLISPSKGQRSYSSDRGLCLSTAVIRAFLGAFGSLLSSQNAIISQTSQGEFCGYLFHQVPFQWPHRYQHGAVH